MRIDWWTLGLQAINVLILVWILGRFLFKPIAGIVAERQAEADRILSDARAAQDKAEVAERDARAAADKAVSERGALIEAAKRDADKQKDTLIAAAQAEAQRLRDAARKEAEGIRGSETARANAEAGQLAVDIAARLFRRLPAEAQVMGFVAGLADAAAALPQAARDGIASAGGALTLAAPRALLPDEETAVHSALAKALGHDVTLAVTVDPAVIAGLEIETPFAAVRNSFRSDLETIAAGLAGEDDTHG